MSRTATPAAKPNPRDRWPAWTDWVRPVLDPKVPTLPPAGPKAMPRSGKPRIR